MIKKGFTLAEVLITLAIIGIVAAISIPSVISNTEQQEFKTGLRKAVSVLNSAITMNIALDGESPYENNDLMSYLMRHMSVMDSTTSLRSRFFVHSIENISWDNGVFYTTDGMRFEFYDANSESVSRFPLYENPEIKACLGATTLARGVPELSCGGCGSLGLNSNNDETTKPPCLIMVDVNGDRKPNPQNANCKSDACASKYKFANPDGTRLTDIFSIMITDKQAIPYGTAAQKAMYQNQKGK